MKQPFEILGYRPLENSRALAWAEEIIEHKAPLAYLDEGLKAQDPHIFRAAALLLWMACPDWPQDRQAELELMLCQARARATALVSTPGFLRAFPDLVKILAQTVLLVGLLGQRLHEMATGVPHATTPCSDETEQVFQFGMAVKMKQLAREAP